MNKSLRLANILLRPVLKKTYATARFGLCHRLKMRCLILQAFTSTSSQWALEKDLLSVLSPSEIWKPNNGLIPRWIARTRRTGCARSTSRMTNPGPGPVSTRKSTHVHTFRVCACAYTRMYLPSRSGKVSSSLGLTRLSSRVIYTETWSGTHPSRGSGNTILAANDLIAFEFDPTRCPDIKYEWNNEG